MNTSTAHIYTHHQRRRDPSTNNGSPLLQRARHAPVLTSPRRDISKATHTCPSSLAVKIVANCKDESRRVA